MVASRRGADLAFDGVILLICLVAVAVALYPFIYVLSVSISDAEEAFKGKVWIVPAGLSFKAYAIVLDNPGMWRSYYNTVWYVVVGTAVNITLTILAAYPLSRRELLGKNLFIIMMVLTGYVSGGLIPFYRLVKEIGLFNTRWALVLPTAVSFVYIIILRTFFRSLPDELEDAAIVDGAGRRPCWSASPCRCRRRRWRRWCCSTPSATGRRSSTPSCSSPSRTCIRCRCICGAW